MVVQPDPAEPNDCEVLGGSAARLWLTSGFCCILTIPCLSSKPSPGGCAIGFPHFSLCKTLGKQQLDLLMA
jgi:hypothetical protein